MSLTLLFLLMLVPLAAVNGIISQRSERKQEVVRAIAQAVGGRQKILSPVLVIAFTTNETHVDTQGLTRTEVVSRERWIAPENLTVNGALQIEERYRGIYKVPVFHATLRVAGRFPRVDRKALRLPDDAVVGKVRFLLGVSDADAVERADAVRLSGQRYPFERSTLDDRSSALSADVGTIADGDAAEFETDLGLSGTETLSVAPSGRTTAITLKSRWPHPSFVGSSLPTQRDVSADGFEARWERSGVNADLQGLLKDCEGAKCVAALEAAPAAGVSIVDPVDVYSLSDRSVKYGWLFVALTFAACFLIEVLRKVPVHPMQYAFIGSALGIFFLLLIALSEHLPFAVAYALASLACVALVTVYSARVLGHLGTGLAFGAKIAVLYGALFVILRSEDYALVMGAALVFAVLALAMLLTRNIDWSSLSTQLGGTAPAGQGGSPCPYREPGACCPDGLP